ARLIEGLDLLAMQADRQVSFGLIQPVLAREDEDEAQLDASRANLAPGTLVGSFDTVAARLAELAGLGITHFVLSAEPSVEEAYRIGQHVLPRLRALLAPNRAAA
ncbi:MAG TPA: hypothetical protein VF481_02115, partial [Novosphingobium sp.]